MIFFVDLMLAKCSLTQSDPIHKLPGNFLFFLATFFVFPWIFLASSHLDHVPKGRTAPSALSIGHGIKKSVTKDL
jgi:hypothetical protein